MSELILLHATHYRSGEITRKKDLNINKLSRTLWELWPAQYFGFRGDKYKTKKVRVVFLDARSGPYILYPLGSLGPLWYI